MLSPGIQNMQADTQVALVPPLGYPPIFTSTSSGQRGYQSSGHILTVTSLDSRVSGTRINNPVPEFTTTFCDGTPCHSDLWMALCTHARGQDSSRASSNRDIFLRP